MELDPDKERWRQVAKDWFARDLTITPNSGKLQHHLEILCRDKDGLDEELRGVYHFIKRCVVFEELRRHTQVGVPSMVPSILSRRRASPCWACGHSRCRRGDRPLMRR